MTPRTRKPDQTERCAQCGKRGQRNEMLLDSTGAYADVVRAFAGTSNRGVRGWYCPACWDALHKPKEVKDAV